MKQCPRCNRSYTDDTLSYCLDDGTVLIRKYDPQATQISPFPTLVAPPPPPYKAQPAAGAASEPAPRQGFPLWAVGAMVVAALLVGLSIGAFIYQSYGPPATETASAQPTPRAMNFTTATPTPVAATPTPLPTATPIATSSPSVVQSTPEPVRNCVLYNDKSDKSMVRVRANCDTQDCDTDASTIVGEYPDNTPIRIIQGSQVRGQNFTWIKVVIISSGRVVWVASSKTKCS